MIRNLDTWAAMVLGVLLAGCDAPGAATGTGNSLTTIEVSGRYVATTLILTQGTETIDLLASAGTSLELTLHTEGTTSGRFFVPEIQGAEATGIDVELSGAWTLAGDRVRLLHEADSLIREIVYTFDQGTLVGRGEDTADGIDLEVTLTRL